MYIYTTQRFDELAARYRLTESINKLSERLKKNSIRLILDSIGPYYKKRYEKLRVLAKIERVQDDEVLCFIDVLERKGRDYKALLQDPVGYGQEYLDPLIHKSALVEFLRKEKENGEPRRDLLPSEMLLWLEPPQMGIDPEEEDLVIYEGAEWVKRFRRPEIQRYWQSFFHILSRVVFDAIECQPIPTYGCVNLYGEEGHYILCADAEVSNLDTINRPALFLIAAFNYTPSEHELAQFISEAGLFHNYKDDSSVGRIKLNPDELARYARRSYPGYIIADADSWFAIETEEEANLALSAEEELVLKSVSLPKKDQPSLPIFINGRAGSGKSTMLLYLFADYCYRKIQQNLPGSPLFLTYNERLLEVAKDGVRKLLTSHHKFLEQGELEEVILSPLDDFFQPFQKFLLGLLPSEERARFKPENYISFHTFKRLYNREAALGSGYTNPAEGDLASRERTLVLKLPQAKNWSPELSWYVIRTFIKGYLAEGYMSPEDYEEVPRRERIIPNHLFESIYNLIWDKWYRPLTTEKGYWDDQDLIRRVLELECAQAGYTAIFCDEAQDFTRLELKLVMQLSLFSLYDLGHQPIHSLPFAFAGDPFQTLNPTGFRWSSVQSAFYEEVITVLDPSRSWGLNMNFRELAFNYRSTPAIVRATNLIQLWRHALFGLRDLKPQLWWQKDESPDPLKFILGKNISGDELRRVVENTIIIVPCEEGQESAFVNSDAVLSRVFSLGSLEEPPKNILSAITAKGLEFKRVILYKFGERCDESVWQFSDEDDAKHPVEYEYFFNKLYVAASRAMERLFIVDSPEGDEKLWKHANSLNELEPILKKADRPGDWSDNIQIISIGTLEDAQGMHEDDPIHNAKQFEEKGMRLQNAGLLKRAKQFYSSIGQNIDAARCEAWALRIEHDYSKASHLFLSLNLADESGECLWEGMLWPDLVKWSRDFSGRMNDESSIAGLFVAPTSDSEAIKTFRDFLATRIGEAKKNSATSEQWRLAVREFANRIAGLNEPELEKDVWQQAGAILEELGEGGYPEVIRHAAECYYRAGSFSRAIACWNICDVTEIPAYYLAKARVDDTNSLMWLDKAGAYKEILDEWIRAGGVQASADKPWPKYVATAIERMGENSLLITEWEKAGGTESKPSPQWLRIIAPALENAGRRWEAVQVYVQVGNPAKALENLKFVEPPISRPGIWEEINRLIDFLIRRGDDGNAIEAMDKCFSMVQGYEDEKTSLQCAIVKKIAHSNETPTSLTPYLKDRYTSVVDKVLSKPIDQWEGYLSVREAGRALETLGNNDETLKFYERFVSSNDPGLRLHSRRRWIANKRKQEDKFQQEGQTFVVVQVHTELERKCRTWSIPIDINLPYYPTLDKESIEDEGVRGLPADTPYEKRAEGVIQFRVSGVEVKVDKLKRRVQVQDQSTWDNYLVDFNHQTLRGPDGSVVNGIEGQLHFDVSENGFIGEAFFSSDIQRLELARKDSQERIIIEI